MTSSLHNYLRKHRQLTGLSQEEVSRLLGGRVETTVLRHERGQRLPSLRHALGYAIVYRTTVDELFSGAKEEVNREVNERARRLLGRMKDGPGQECLRDLVDDPDIHLVPYRE